jgi:hypothetical protein
MRREACAARRAAVRPHRRTQVLRGSEQEAMLLSVAHSTGTKEPAERCGIDRGTPGCDARQRQAAGGQRAAQPPRPSGRQHRGRRPAGAAAGRRSTRRAAGRRLLARLLADSLHTHTSPDHPRLSPPPSHTPFQRQHLALHAAAGTARCAARPTRVAAPVAPPKCASRTAEARAPPSRWRAKAALAPLLDPARPWSLIRELIFRLRVPAAPLRLPHTSALLPARVALPPLSSRPFAVRRSALPAHIREAVAVTCDAAEPSASRPPALLPR